jgi:hypothetical protein
VAYLGTCAQHYPPDKVVSLWKQTMAKHVASEGLWKVGGTLYMDIHTQPHTLHTHTHIHKQEHTRTHIHTQYKAPQHNAEEC